MLHVSDNFSQAILADTRDMPYRVTLNGSIVMYQTQIPNMTLNESMGSSSGVTLGSANAAELTLTLRDPAVTRYNGMLVEPESGIVLPDGSIEWVPLGKFWVTNTSTSNDYKTVKLSCADGMYNMSGEYESKLSYPASVKDFVHEIVENTGISFIEPESWPDIKIRLKPEKMTYRNAIGHAAGCCGWNARFNRNGDLEFVWYKDSGITIERNTQYMDGMTKLNDKPLDVHFQVTGEKERYKVNIRTDSFGSVYAIPSNGILEGDTVTLSVRPNFGYELLDISASSASGPVTLHTNADGAGYTFTQPDGDVTVVAQFNPEKAGSFNIFRTVNTDDVFPSNTPGYVVINTSEENIEIDGTYKAGALISVRFARSLGYVFGRHESNVAMSQVSDDYFEFIMPSHDVSITAFFDWEIDESKNEKYSWLQYPVTPPSQKKFWAVLYKGSPDVPPSKRYELLWFDSWADLGRGRETGFESQTRLIEFRNYYRCGSVDNGLWSHSWDASTWSGNGTTSTKIDVHVEKPSSLINGTVVIYPYSLVASNIPFFLSDGKNVIKPCPDAIQSPQTSFIVDGADIREDGVYSFFNCPDSVLTPPPASNWMVVKAVSYNDFKMKFNDETGEYERDSVEFYTNEAYNIVFFDDIEIENVGAVFDGSNEEFYVAKITNGHVCMFSRIYGYDWGDVYSLSNGSVIGLRDPSNGIEPKWNISGTKIFCGVLASTVPLNVGSKTLMFKNDCKICDCASAASTFSLRSGPVAEPVTLVYTNPLICEKMVPSIQAVVQGISYTPAKLKHRGNPAFQAGDIVTVPDGDGVYHTVLIQQQTMTFGGGMNSEISCPGQTADTANFNANSPVSTQIKQEVDQSRAEIEYQIAVNNAAIYAAVYSALGEANASLNTQLENATESIIEHDGKIEKLEEGLLGMEYNVGYIEQDVANLKDRVDTLDEEMAAVQADIDEIRQQSGFDDGLKDRVDALDDAVTDMQADIDEIKQQGSSQAGIKRTLLAKTGSLVHNGVTFDIDVKATLDWVAEELFYDAVRKYKMFQIDIISSSTVLDGCGLTSFVVGNPCLENPNLYSDMGFYHMLKPGLYIYVVGGDQTGDYKTTFAVTPRDANGLYTTLKKVIGIGIYGIE